MKLLHLMFLLDSVLVAPARERGLKCPHYHVILFGYGRSREGAWIEIRQWAVRCMHEAVAPARERGLKLLILYLLISLLGRSREGAWIEMKVSKKRHEKKLCRSREGAWIEIVEPLLIIYALYNADRRSREGAWIEIRATSLLVSIIAASLPRGSVD